MGDEFYFLYKRVKSGRPLTLYVQNIGYLRERRMQLDRIKADIESNNPTTVRELDSLDFGYQLGYISKIFNFAHFLKIFEVAPKTKVPVLGTEYDIVVMLVEVINNINLEYTTDNTISSIDDQLYLLANIEVVYKIFTLRDLECVNYKDLLEVSKIRFDLSRIALKNKDRLSSIYLSSIEFYSNHLLDRAGVPRGDSIQDRTYTTSNLFTDVSEALGELNCSYPSSESSSDLFAKIVYTNYSPILAEFDSLSDEVKINVTHTLLSNRSHVSPSLEQVRMLIVDRVSKGTDIVKANIV